MGAFFGLKITTLEPIGGNLGIGEMRDLGKLRPDYSQRVPKRRFRFQNRSKEAKKQPERRPWGETALGDYQSKPVS